MKKKSGGRAYICHTFYHAYIAALKELKLKSEGRTADGALLILSMMSTDFGNLKDRAVKSGIFRDAVIFDEKDYTYFDELLPLKKDTGRLPSNMMNRIRFCRRLGDLEAEYVPVDLNEFDDIYVFCDSDPIGYYLNRKKIRYHALEDGLDCIRYRDTAIEDNRGSFGVKVFMSKLGLIFIQNGYGRYCIDMEVNDISVLDHPMNKMKEVRRKDLTDRLTEKDREALMTMFIEGKDELDAKLKEAQEKKLPVVLILTEPLCQDLSVRKQLFCDMIEEYGRIDGEKAQILIKPHPRDLLDYSKEFSQYIVLDSHFPMEILNFTGAQFDRVVTVYTVPSAITCAKEKVYLGNEFMDRYEDPALHAKVTNSVKTVTTSQ